MFWLAHIILLVAQNFNLLSEGDICAFQSGEAGVCKNIYACPSAKALLMKGIRRETCSYKGSIPIVCCEIEKQKQIQSQHSPQKLKTKRPVGQISKEKCKEYGKSVYEVMKAPTLRANDFINSSLCATTHKTLIVGGEKAEPAEFPHQALLGFLKCGELSWECGGTLISKRYVLTAAHCLLESLNTVRLGELDYGSNNDKADPQDFKIVEAIIHPKRNLLNATKYHDIALIKLDRMVKLNRYIRPACLHTTFNIPPTFDGSSKIEFLATGWGLTEFGGSLSKALMKVKLDFYDRESCKRYYGKQRLMKDGIDDKTQFCAKGTDPKKNKDTCQGDSGGPLVTYNKEVYCMYSLVGVTSFGKQACGHLNTPAIYTRVSHYVEWIEDIVWPQ